MRIIIKWTHILLKKAIDYIYPENVFCESVTFGAIDFENE